MRKLYISHQQFENIIHPSFSPCIQQYHQLSKLKYPWTNKNVSVFLSLSLSLGFICIFRNIFQNMRFLHTQKSSQTPFIQRKFENKTSEYRGIELFGVLVYTEILPRFNLNRIKHVG